MKLLEDRISADGFVAAGGVLKVDSFLNHNVDCELLCKLAREWKRLFAGEEITKILTIEASGIAPAVAVGIEFGLPVIYAKRHLSSVKSDDVYAAKVVSFTNGSSYTATVSKKYLDEFIAKLDGITPGIRLFYVSLKLAKILLLTDEIALRVTHDQKHPNGTQ